MSLNESVLCAWKLIPPAITVVVVVVGWAMCMCVCVGVCAIKNYLRLFFSNLTKYFTMSDRVRYYLEGSVKEIQDLKSRGIFEQNELAKIMKRRTEYEHRLLSRKVKPEDFLAYAKYEMQVDKLRQLRIKRLKLGGKKSVSDWSGSRRINFTLERGTKRFPASLKIWMSVVDYAHSKQSVNVVKKALSSMLKLHPTNPEVWVYVAKYQVEQNASVPEARAVLQRGLRINPQSQFLWLEYMRLELIYVAKIMARRKLLGIDYARKEEIAENEKPSAEDELTSEDLARANADALRDLPDVNIEVLGDAESNPALRGDVALAIFDAGLARFSENENIRKEFVRKTLDLFDQFSSMNRQYLCSHVFESLHNTSDPEIESWEVLLPIRYTPATDPSFPDLLRQVFNLYERSSKSVELKDRMRTALAEKVLEPADVDSNLQKAVQIFFGKL